MTPRPCWLHGPRWRGTADELPFCTNCIDPVEPLAVLAPRMEIFARRMARARPAGFRAGLNWLFLAWLGLALVALGAAGSVQAVILRYHTLGGR